MARVCKKCDCQINGIAQRPQTGSHTASGSFPTRNGIEIEIVGLYHESDGKQEMDNKSEAGWNWKVAELSGDHPYGEMWNRVCCNSSGLADAVTKFANALQGRQVYDVSGNPDHAKPDFGKFWSGASEDSQCWQILPTRDTLVDHLMATNERLVGIIESLGRPTVVDFGVPEGKKNA